VTNNNVQERQKEEVNGEEDPIKPIDLVLPLDENATLQIILLVEGIHYRARFFSLLVASSSPSPEAAVITYSKSAPSGKIGVA
jgi:hypothetical protein